MWYAILTFNTSMLRWNQFIHRKRNVWVSIRQMSYLCLSFSKTRHRICLFLGRFWIPSHGDELSARCEKSFHKRYLFSVGFPNFWLNERRENKHWRPLHAIFLLAFRTAQPIKNLINASAIFPARDYAPTFPHLSSRFCRFLSANPSTNAASSNFDSLSACRFSRLRRASSAWRRFSAASRSCSSWEHNGIKV